MTTVDDVRPQAETDELPDPGFGAAVRSEWTKLWTAKGPRRNLALGAVLGIGMSLLLALAAGATFDDWSANDRAQFDPILYSHSGAILSGIFFVAVGVRAATAEYTSGMIRLTFTATPRRGRVLAAKAVVVTVAIWIFAVVAVLGMTGGSQLVFGAFDLPTVELADGDLWRATVLIVALVPVFPVLGVVAGFLLRGTASALTAVLALMLGPGIFGALFPLWWRENVLSLLPGPAVDAVSIGHINDSAMYLSFGPAAAVAALWVVVPLLAARQVLLARDA